MPPQATIRKRWPVRRLSLVAAALLLFPLLAGCWDRRELEELAFVLALGLDRAPQGIEVSAMLAIPNRMAGGGGGDADGGGGGGEENVVAVTSIAAPTIPEAMNLLNAYTSRAISLEHAKVLVVGRELAERQGLGEVLDFLDRNRAIRATMAVAISQGTAQQLLSRLHPRIERDPHRFLEFLPLLDRETGLIPHSARFNDLLAATENPGMDGTAYLIALRPQPGQQQQEGSTEEGARPGGESAGGDGSSGEGGNAGLPGPGQWVAGNLPRQGGANAEMVGAAILREARLVGVATGQETRAINLLRGELRRAALSVPDPLAPGQEVGLEIRPGRLPIVRAELDGERPHLTVIAPQEATVLGVQSRLDYARDEGRIARLAAATSALLEATAREVIRKAQTEWRADPFGFGLKVARLFPTYREWREYDWSRRFPGAEVEVRIPVQIRRPGTRLEPPRVLPTS